MQGVPDDEHHIVHITQLLFLDYRSQFPTISAYSVSVLKTLSHG